MVLNQTCLTDTAISGPIPSPGKRVALMGAGAEEKALAVEEIWVEPLPPRTRLITCIRAIDLSILMCCSSFRN